MRIRRRHGDEQPTAPVAVLLASDGRQPFSDAAVAAALAAADGGAVAVLTIARIYGTSLGLPNPGLMPTRQELDERRRWIGAAAQALRRGGVRDVDGQVAATRRHARLIARVAQARDARVVVIDETTAHGIRRRVEGDAGEAVARRLRRTAIEVRIVPRPPAARGAARLDSAASVRARPTERNA